MHIVPPKSSAAALTSASKRLLPQTSVNNGAPILVAPRSPKAVR